jgi:hypothetical protein
MQLRFLRTIAPVEILVGAERRRAPELVIVDIELVGLDPRVVGWARPRLNHGKYQAALVAGRRNARLLDLSLMQINLRGPISRGRAGTFAD